MAWFNLPTRTTADANASTDINDLMENIRVLGGNGTSAPSSDIETLFTNAVSLTSQAGVPSSTPTAVGQFNLDTTANRLYVATGTASSADWDKIAVYAYGVTTVTSGGGDVTVTLPWSWENGMLWTFQTGTSSEYYDDSGSPTIYWAPYDSLTDNEATYSTDHTIYMNINPTIATRDKSTNAAGLPKSATTLSFTLDDDGASTKYVKWMVIA
jgi:hypothetical protein